MDIRNKISEIYSLEQLSAGKSVLHSLHPGAKLIFSFVFIITVISFGRHDFGRLVPYIFYPAVLIPLSGTPYALLFKRFVLAAPFCLFMGISAVLLEKETAFSAGNISVSFGILSLSVIIYRTWLCVMAVLLLAAVTPLSELSAQLRRLGMPDIFITMFEMTYRYLGVLFTEAASMRTAYALRSAGTKGVDIRHAGTFIGCLLLRSFDRAERIYAAMKCRGYGLHCEVRKTKTFRMRDALFCAVVCSLCLLFRFVDARRLIQCWIF